MDAAQVVSGFAALAAVMLAMATAKAGRRTPLTDAYMGAWQSILDTVAVATESREEPPPDESADLLMRQFKSADHRLSVIEATIRVRLYGRDIRHDLKNLLLDVLYDNHDIREPGVLTLSDFPRPEWAGCSDEEWVRVVNSVPFASMLVSQVWSLPGRTDDSDGLMRWYYPTVLHGLGAHDSVTASDAPPAEAAGVHAGCLRRRIPAPVDSRCDARGTAGPDRVAWTPVIVEAVSPPLASCVAMGTPSSEVRRPDLVQFDQRTRLVRHAAV